MRIIHEWNIENFNAYDWQKKYDMRDDFFETLNKLSYEEMKAFNKYVEENTEELDVSNNDLEDLYDEWENQREEKEKDEE